MNLDIYFLSRSGSHAIIEWIASHFDDYNLLKHGTRRKIVGGGYNRISCFENKSHESHQDTTIKILRDPLNWVASGIAYGRWGTLGTSVDRKAYFHPDDFSKNIEQYKNYMHSPGILIKYNDWFISSEYRRLIEQTIGLKLNVDTTINNVPITGGGSSFDKLLYNGRATEMNTLNRWRSLSWHPLIQSVLSDNALMEYAIKEFNLEI